MDLELQKYLDTINKYLKSMNKEERVDILEEIKTNIIDMKNNENLTNKQIISRLGEPKQLAKL